MIARLRRLGPLLGICLALPVPAAAEVLLATTVYNVTYTPDTFGRQLSFVTGWATQIPDGPCSDVPLDDVVLVLDLPPDTTLVSESLGSGVYDAVAGTVTWQPGTVQPCVIQYITVTLDVDPSVPDGTSLQATATVTTSTPGDDPSDNQYTGSFVIGFQPLEVSRTLASAACDRISGTTTYPNATRLYCNNVGGTLHGASATGVVGYIDNGPVPDVVRIGSVLASVGNYLTGDDVSTTVDGEITVTNPNPYPVRLHAHRETYTSCWVDNGGTVDAYVLDVGHAGFAECGFGNLSQMVERSVSRFDAEGEPGGVCSLTIEGYSSERGSLDAMGSTPTCLEQSVGANGARLFRLDSFAGYATYRGHGNVVTRWAIGLAGSPAEANATLFTIAGGSPVLLRLRDADGFEAGAVDLGAGPEARIDLPGSFYNGVDADPQELQVGLPEPGTYVLEVLGTGAGSYAITLQATDLGGVVMGELVLTGEASDGSLDSFVVTLHDDGTLTLGGEAVPALGQPLLLVLALALAGLKYFARSASSLESEA